MRKPCSCIQFIKCRIFYCKSSENLYYHYYKSCENPYQVLQVTCAVSEHAMKSKVICMHHFSFWPTCKVASPIDALSPDYSNFFTAAC